MRYGSWYAMPCRRLLEQRKVPLRQRPIRYLVGLFRHLGPMECRSLVEQGKLPLLPVRGAVLCGAAT